MPETPQKTLGKYQIQGELGKGAMGVVYRGFDPALEREVAIKVMGAATLSDPELKKRFEQEAKASARLQHPNIVTVYDFGYDDQGVPYMAMEFLKGQRSRAADPEKSTNAQRKTGRGRADLPWSRARSRAPYRSPRYQTREHLHLRERHREDHGFRRRAAYAVLADANGHRARNGGLYVSGADPRAKGRRPLRHFQRWRHPLSAFDEQETVHRRQHPGGLLQSTQSGGARVGASRRWRRDAGAPGDRGQGAHEG